MREKIAKIIGELRCWEGTNYDTPLDVADAILSLLVEGCGEVKEKCPECKGEGEIRGKDCELITCPNCIGGFVSRPHSLGELPEKHTKMLELLSILKRFITEEIIINGDYKLYERIKKLNKQINDTIKEVKDV